MSVNQRTSQREGTEAETILRFTPDEMKGCHFLMNSIYYVHTIKYRVSSCCCYICHTSHQRALNQLNGQLWIVLFFFNKHVYSTLVAKLGINTCFLLNMGINRLHSTTLSPFIRTELISLQTTVFKQVFFSF